MDEPTRMVDGARAPTAKQVAAWIGPRSVARWTQLTEFIDTSYPGVFETKWYFGGKKHGWAFRYKKSRSFCTLIPERGRFKALLVFGAAEREKVEAILPDLVSHVRDDYATSPTFYDGKWVAPIVDSAQAVADVKRLLTFKRAPKTSANYALASRA